MSESVLVFRLIDRRSPHVMAPVQGRSGNTYATARFDAEHNGHIFRLTGKEAIAAGLDLAQGSQRHMCGFVLVAVEQSGESRESELLAEIERLNGIIRGLADLGPVDDLDDLTFKQLYPIAQEEDVPRKGYYTKTKDLLEAIRENRRQRDKASADAAPSEQEAVAV